MAYNYSRLKCLIADDSNLMRELLRGLLEAIELRRVRTCDNADSAWALLFEFEPDFIITDWNMPGDGLDLVRRIRTDPRSPNRFIPILMVTGYAELDRVEEARDAGVSEFLIKPLTGQALFDRIEALVDDERGFVQAHPFFGPDRRRGSRDQYGGDERRGSLRRTG